jgi:hypothetical protein
LTIVEQKWSLRSEHPALESARELDRGEVRKEQLETPVVVAER